MDNKLIRSCLAEAIGTFVLVFAGTGAIIINDTAVGSVTHVGIALTFGLVVMAMIYTLGDVSGAHINPAATIAFWAARRFPARQVAGDRFDVYSAGTEPKGIDPVAIQVLNEIGIDTSGVSSKHVSEYLGKLPVDYAIIVCDDAAEKCPRIWPGMRHKLLWPFEDPPKFQGTEEEKLAKYGEVRDAIRERLVTWLNEVEP